MKFLSYTAVFIICLGHLTAQPKKTNIEYEFSKDSMPPNWDFKNKLGVDINQVSFVNWNAGGTNSISGRITFLGHLNYKSNSYIWNNRLNIRYGLNKQEGRTLRKTDDVLNLTSTLGYQFSPESNWYYSANFTLKTQFSKGFNYGVSENKPISKFMAPGYAFLGLGTVYGKNIKNFSIYMSPLTLKSTYVLDRELANSGAFGVQASVRDGTGKILKNGRMSRHEFGVLITNDYSALLMENIRLDHHLKLYSDYINEFGNVDIDWEVLINFTINDYFKATLGSNLAYDDDIKVIEENSLSGEENVEVGSRVQWKQLLGLGIELGF